MRILRSSVPLVVFIFVTTIAVAQKTHTGVYMQYLGPSDVPAPPADSPKIDPSKVKFLPRGQCDVSTSSTFQQKVSGVVAPEIDLSDDGTAWQILEMGFAYGREQCPSHGEGFQGVPYVREVFVALKPGDPATFTVDKIPVVFNQNGSIYDFPPDLVIGDWLNSKPEIITSYRNAPKALKLSQADDAKQAKQQNAAQVQATQAKQTRQAQNAARSAAFFKSNGVTRIVTVEQLATNPFVFKGQVVAIRGFFSQMNSETQATFHIGDSFFVVSGVPSTKFIRQGDAFMLAARVIGKTNDTGLPHLSYVGSGACQDLGCGEYISNFR